MSSKSLGNAPVVAQPASGFLRLPQIIGQRGVTDDQAKRNRERGCGPRRARPAIQPIIPVSRSTWWQGVKEGRFPAPVKIGPRVTAWRSSDVFALLETA